jgi:hypothetical protein
MCVCPRVCMYVRVYAISQCIMLDTFSYTVPYTVFVFYLCPQHGSCNGTVRQMQAL